MACVYSVCSLFSPIALIIAEFGVYTCYHDNKTTTTKWKFPGNSSVTKNKMADKTLQASFVYKENQR